MHLPILQARISVMLLALAASAVQAQSPGPFSVISPDPLVPNPNGDYKYFLQQLSDAETFVVESSDNVPEVIGFRMPLSAYNALPTKSDDPNQSTRPKSDRTLCNNDADRLSTVIDPTGCVSGYRAFFPLKSENADRPDQPYEFVQLSWNPNGYGSSSGAFARPLLGVHFYFNATIDTVNGIGVGTADSLLTEDALARVNMPVPTNFFPEGYNTFAFGTPRMGGHRVNFVRVMQNAGTRNQGIIFGQYDAELIFVEPVIFDEQITTITGSACDEADEAGDSACQKCQPVDQPARYRQGGYYATQYCTTHIPDTNGNALLEFTLHDFKLKEANPVSSSSNSSGTTVINLALAIMTLASAFLFH